MSHGISRYLIMKGRKTMKKSLRKKVVSIVLATLITVMALPVGMFAVQATTAQDITSGLTKILLQDLTDFEPWGPNIWYSTGMADAPACNAEKGLFFTQTGTDGVLGEANIRIYTLKTRSCLDTDYLTVTFQKNQVSGSFKTAFVFDINIGWGYVGLYGNGDPNVYYDNGGDSLVKAEYAVMGDNNKELTFNVGSSSTITVYIPMASITIPNGAAIDSVSLQKMTLNSFGIQFTDMGNKGTEISNENAVSVRELAMYCNIVADDATVAGDAYTSKFEEITLQDFSGDIALSDLWYNQGVTNTPCFNPLNKGLFISDEGGHFGSGRVHVNKLITNDITDAEYLAVTFRKNGISDSFSVTLYLASGEHILKSGSEILYDNGSDTLQKAVVGSDNSLTLATGTSNIVKAYIPVSSICSMYVDDFPIDDNAKKSFTTFGMDFINLGNKDTEIPNSNAVSVKKISMYKPKTILDDETPAADAFVNGLQKSVLQDFNSSLANGTWWPGDDWSNPGLDVWYNPDLTNTPTVNSYDKGLYFADNGTSRCEANIKIAKLASKDITDAEYIAVTFRKNSISSFKLNVNFMMGFRGEVVIRNGAEIYYDNGSETLQKATVVQEGDAYSRFITLDAGDINVVKMFIPVSDLTDMAGKHISAEQIENLDCIGFYFVNLGNKNTQIPDSDAVSIREIAIYKSTPVADDETVAGDALVSGLKKSVLQDFKSYLNVGEMIGSWDEPLCDVYYNSELSSTPAFDLNNKGLYVSNGNIHGTENLAVTKLNTHNLFDAEYLAVTFRKNSLDGQFKVKFDIVAFNNDFVLAEGTEVLYDNGDAQLQKAVADENNTVTFTTGTANVVKAYIPVSLLVNLYNGVAIARNDLNYTQGIFFDFEDLGNKENPEALNSDMVSIREISVYSLNLNLNVNQDELVDIDDLVEFRKVLLGYSEITSFFDINLDGKCDIIDLIVLKKLFV